jgi:hypothetical protein
MPSSTSPSRRGSCRTFVAMDCSRSERVFPKSDGKMRTRETRLPDVLRRALGRAAPSALTATFTFDRRATRERTWSTRSRSHAGAIRYDVTALTEDGWLLSFGPFETTTDRIQVAIVAAKVSDSHPAEFEVEAPPLTRRR